MKKGLNVIEMSREEWLAERRKGIGGSDVAAILGLNPWKSAAGVYLEKTGEVIPEDLTSERIRVGHDLEDYVARRFAEATGKKVRRNNFMLYHDEYDFIFADIDREVVGENAILECKTTNSYAKKDWQSEPPLHYQMQCQHYMLVTGADRCYIAVLIGNEEFKWFTIERDEETMQALLKLEIEFWNNNVLAGVCPDPDGSVAYDDLLKKRYPYDDGGIIAFNDKYEDILQQYLDVCDELDSIEKRHKTLQQMIKDEMGEASKAYSKTDVVITWKTQSRTTLDTKALKKEMPDVYEKYAKTSESRVFRLKK